MKKNTFNFSYKYNREREKAVDKAIRFIKNCPYKGTAIKIELEAFLGRTSDRRDSCDACNATGEVICKCEGLEQNCPICKGRGYIPCSLCDGQGENKIKGKRRTELYCQEFILSHVTPEAREHLIFSKTYLDGTVDTEFTFTLPLHHVRDSIEFIKAFALLAEDIGAGISTNSAGMHIAILNSPTGKYGSPKDGNHLEKRRYQNFAKSMTHLLPALYFLASPDNKSRRLGYRVPQISTDKYSAINAGHRVFEYRVFETCYQRPEAILDNLCVIANTLKYYSYHYTKHSFFGKIGKFGFEDYGHGLDRFFRTEVNYRALMAGIKMLKPSYKTIKQLKKERNFDLTLKKIQERDAIKTGIYGKEFHAERKSIAELKELYKTEYKKRAVDPAFKKTYPKSSLYIARMIPELSILKTGKEKYIDDKKKQALKNVSQIINI
jgi:hypothetical protein